MQVLVTGGLGVNGSWVLRKLVEEGERPICFDYSSDTSLVSDIVNKIQVVKGDISDGEAVLKAVKENSVNSVIHVAALVSPDVTSLDPMKANPVKGFEVNARGTLNILEAAKVSGVKRVVYTSSKGVYGEITGSYGHPYYHPVTEEHPKNPLSIYDITKLFGEHLGELYSRLYGIEFVSLRFAHIYGPGKLERHGPLSVHDRILMNAINNVRTKIERGGDGRDDLIYVRDVGKAVVLAWKASKLPHQAYNFGTGRAYSLKEFAVAVKELFPQAEIEIGPGLGYYGESVKGTACAIDYGLAREDLGFYPDYDLGSGVRDYVKWITNR